ncbi:MAG: hypothetical protein QNI91_06080 [Arenicellales bacterium]|nr:hypothetical protein [Arenicellales bacterium]
MDTENRQSTRWILGKIVWVAFSIVFFYSGLFLTEWLLDAETFAGGWRWIMIAAFPFLIPAMLIVNRRFGCATGTCKKNPADKDSLPAHFPLA